MNPPPASTAQGSPRVYISCVKSPPPHITMPKALSMYRVIAALFLFALCLGAVSAADADHESPGTVQDKGLLLRGKADELLEYVRATRVRHTSGNPFSYGNDFKALNQHIEEWKKLLLAESGYITKQQEENWRFCGAGYGDYRPCFYQHASIQACLSALQRETSDEKMSEALANLEKEIQKAADDSMIAAKEANKNAAAWIDVWLRKNGGSSVSRLMQTYRNAGNAAQIDAFIQCWYSGEFWHQTSFNIKDKLECVMFVLLSERANFAASFGGCGGSVRYSKGRAYCFAPDYTEGLSHSIQKHFSEDASMLSFLNNRLSPSNRLTICQVLFPIDEL